MTDTTPPTDPDTAADEAFIQGQADTRRRDRPRPDPALHYAPYFEVPGTAQLPAHLAPPPLVLAAHLYAAILTLPPSAEKTAACRKLLEARDCIVRATP
jgi:hypothetical protein